MSLPLQELLHQMLDSVTRGQAVAYTQLIDTRGSTPQKAGAAMLVYSDGRQVGTLGGGCVEAEVKRSALTVLPRGQKELLTFQLDSDYGWDDGLVCGGRMRVLVDPLQPPVDLSYYQALSSALDLGTGCTEAVVTETGPAGNSLDRYLLDREGRCLIASLTSPMSDDTSRVSTSHDQDVMSGLRPLATRPRPYAVGAVSYMPYLPRGKLLIVGGGHVGQKVGDLAADVHFDVTVVDDRAEYVTPERFPKAVRRIAGQLDEILPNLDVDEDTFCIVVTRGHNHDEEALFHLVNRPSRYLGMIGSRRKIKLIFEDLQRLGVSETALARVHAPLGIEIGSQTVPEIAISIVAQLIASRNLEGRDAKATDR